MIKPYSSDKIRISHLLTFRIASLQKYSNLIIAPTLYDQ